MATQIGTIYLQVCDAILEDPGVTVIGLMSVTDFFNYLNDTIQDFVSRTGLYKRIYNIPGEFGIASYAEPNSEMDVHALAYDDNYIYRTSGWYLDNLESEWSKQTGIPERWREDEVPPKTIQIEPIPNIQSWEVAINFTTPAYGQIAATSAVVDFDIISLAAGGYGVISGIQGPLGTQDSLYADGINQGYGTVSDMVSSTGNLSMISTVQPTSYPQTLTDYLYLVPDTFAPYIKYGILERIWSEDGEYKAPDQAGFAQQRYQEGVNLAAAMMSEQGFE